MQIPSGKTCVPTGVELKDTGFGYTLSLISGKYKIVILYWLSEREVMRHNELKRSIGTISFKTLSIMLKEPGSRRPYHSQRISPNPPKG